MSGPPQEHQCGKTLLHTRGFGLKILQHQQQQQHTQNQTETALNKPQQTSSFQLQSTPTLTKRQPSQLQ